MVLSTRSTPPGEQSGKALRGRRQPAPRALVPRTAADAPDSVRRLLKSYTLEDLHWAQKNHRHIVVVTILTRGEANAKRWLWSVSSRQEVRALAKEHRGSGCPEPDRVLLRRQLRLTTDDIPQRPYLGLGWDAMSGGDR